jgi:two-component system, OmpR family, phosphate regulon sensor histidine kinase PhoR
MFEKKSLKWPITLGVVMIVSLVVIIVAWVVITTISALKSSANAGAYWAVLTLGTVLLAFVLLGVVMYLTLSIKAINLNRRQSNFLDAVTHELKSPIASLKLYAQTLSRRQLPAEQHANFIGYMLEDIERLDRLINHLLDAGKITRPIAEQVIETIDVPEMLQEIVASVALRHHFDAERISIQADPCFIRAPRLDADILFRNLVDNAIKYAGDDPRIIVRAGLIAENRVLVTVEDNGRGIPRHLRRRIFGRFVRLGLELERDKPGTGLGLYLVRTITHRLGGKVQIHDPQSGPGTVFEVNLPAVKPPGG